jgi:hypothetical protein
LRGPGLTVKPIFVFQTPPYGGVTMELPKLYL